MGVSMLFEERLPVFVRAVDGNFYQDLVYQDFPQRCAWFICFNDKEPAEIVVRESDYRNLSPVDIIKHRGFGHCVARIINGRKTPHLRFFGVERNELTGVETPIEGHKAVSWFIVFKKGVPLPRPNKNDSCSEIYPFFPNKAGVYFGDQR